MLPGAVTNSKPNRITATAGPRFVQTNGAITLDETHSSVTPPCGYGERWSCRLAW
jgi:hypothetical protein